MNAIPLINNAPRPNINVGSIGSPTFNPVAAGAKLGGSIGGNVMRQNPASMPVNNETQLRQEINTSIVALKREAFSLENLIAQAAQTLQDINKRLSELEGKQGDYVKKSDVVDSITSGNMNPVTSNAVANSNAMPVNSVTSGNMHSVTSGAVYNAISALKTISRWRFSSGSQRGVLPVVNDGYNDNPNIYLDGNKFKFRGTARYLVTVHIIGQIEGSDRLFFKVEGLNLNVYGISYGNYAECDIVFPAEVNINTEIYVNMLESFRIDRGNTASSYIAFSQI